MSVTATVGQQAQAAARANDVWKVYGSGEAQVIALRGVSVELERGRVHRDHGPVGLRQVDADALPGRPGHGDPGRRCTSATTTVDRARRRGPDQAAPRQGRLHLPAVQPAADADRGGEHPAAAVDRRPQAGPGLVRHRHRHGRAARPARPPARRSSPAASSSGSPCARALVSRPEVIFADEPTGNLDSRSGAEVLALPARLGARASARPSSWSPTTRTPPRTPTGSSSSPTARSSTSCTDPTAEAVLDTHEAAGHPGRGGQLMLRATLQEPAGAASSG